MAIVAKVALSISDRLMWILCLRDFSMALLITAGVCNPCARKHELIVTAMRVVTVNALSLQQRFMKKCAFAYLGSLRFQLLHRWDGIQLLRLFLMAAAAELLPCSKQLKRMLFGINQFVAEFAHAERHGLMHMFFFAVGIMAFRRHTVLCKLRGLFLTRPQAGE